MKRDRLNTGQRRAVEHVLSSPDRVMLIRGVAGTGKTTLMQEAVEAGDGNIILDNNWTVSGDFGHVAYGYVVTSHASQGKTVDKAFIGQLYPSLPASDRSQLYLLVSRGKEQALIFTDNKKVLREAVRRGSERLTVTEVFRRQRKPGREQLKRHLSYLRRWAASLFERDNSKTSHTRTPKEKEMNYER